MSLFHTWYTRIKRLPWGTLYLVALGALLLAFLTWFGLWLLLAPYPGILCC